MCIRDRAKAGHYHVACTRLFEITHAKQGVARGDGLGQGESVAHPNRYMEASWRLAQQQPAEAPEDTRQRSQVQVGVDPIRAGFNPHLAGDESAVVADIADLVLPSAFRDGMRDNNVLLGASRLPTTPGALTVRYIIAPEAQWSDGTPITGADFAYLWRGMVTTPGVIAPAGYRAISAVRVSGPAGKTAVSYTHLTLPTNREV